MQDIKELKAYLDKQVVRGILESLGYEFSRAGLFRLRDERTPSASIRRDGLIKDFGSDWSGDIFALLQEYHGMTFKESVDYVANYLGISSNAPLNVQKAPRFIPKPKEEPKPSYDITKMHERFKSQKESLGVKILDQFHNDLIPKHILAQIDHSSLKKMIGYDTRNESFTISLLKGDEVKAVTIQRTKDGTKWGLIFAPNNTIHRVLEGNYMGQNHGRIIALSDSSIDLTEIVPDGLGNYIERSASLALIE